MSDAPLSIIVYGDKRVKLPEGSVSTAYRGVRDFRGEAEPGFALCVTDDPTIAKAYGEAGVDVMPIGGKEAAKEVRAAVKDTDASVKRGPKQPDADSKDKPADKKK